MIKIKSIPRVYLGRAKSGEGFTFKGHPYQYKGATPYKTPGGAARWLVWIGAPCAVCGEGFMFQTNRNPKWLPKTCTKHRGALGNGSGGQR